MLLGVDDASFGTAGVSIDGNLVLVFSKDASAIVGSIAGELAVQLAALAESAPVRLATQRTRLRAPYDGLPVSQACTTTQLPILADKPGV